MSGSGRAIVVLEPRHETPLPDPVNTPYMDQISRTFIPSVMFVRTGHPAEFRNSDEEMHNINVMNLETRTQIFNVAVPMDETYIHEFEEPGNFYVSCDVHPGMSAEIIATSSPYATFAGADGQFEFPDVVPGAYVLRVYAGTTPFEIPVQVDGPRTTIDASHPN